MPERKPKKQPRKRTAYQRNLMREVRAAKKMGVTRAEYIALLEKAKV